ncbi:endonuclease MutS2 [Candidatus Leptofilum sp.]|uniref:endonuclease MutS2 n=1 Tax=Candidatus Leptofilum sp. TaxID=3241576 RepID=UPI003B58F815
MDTKSLHTLEYHKVLNILAGYTSFSAGEELARKLQPTTDQILAEQWQQETAEALLLLDTHTNITIGGARDVRRPAENSTRGFTLPAEDLLDIRSTLIAARTLKRQLLKVEDEFSTLAVIAELVEEAPGLVDAISSTIDEKGEVLDSASSKLGKIRSDLRSVHGRIQDKLQRLLNSSQNQWLQEPLISMRSGRYVVPVKTDAKGRIKGIVHDQSGSGATVWVEPMATVDLNNEYRGLQMSEQAEIERILAELSAKVADVADRIIRIVERMAELDLIFARAKYAAIIKGVPPQFVEWREFEQPKPPKHANERAKWTPPPRNLHPGSTIWIRSARHPLLPPHDVIPTDLTLDDDTFTVLITGPNTGGKTVSLKTTGLMVLMAQSGMHLPAIEARLTVFEDVFADIGDEQSIEQSLSTFSAHMTNIIRILSRVDDRSLVLLDELGSGTDPTEGAALAQSVTNFLRDKGATTFIATHYPELKLYADQQRGATNASMLFDVETLSPTYEMAIGIPGKSNAFAIARRLGLDETILDDAMKLTGAGSNEAENLLDAIYDLRDKISSEEAAARLIRRQLEDEKDALARQLEQLEEEREAVLAEAQEEARQKIAAIEEELRRARKQIRDAQSINKLKKVSKDVAALEEGEVEQIAPKATKARKPTSNRLQLAVGDKVTVKALNTEGEIISLTKYEAMIAVGRLQMRAKLSDLEFKSRPKDEEPEMESTPLVSARSPGVELDIRGRRVEEGLSELTSFIDQAYLSQMPWVRIIHGKGTGKLRTAVRKSLKKNKHVSSIEEGKDGEGGAGVTVVKFN